MSLGVLVVASVVFSCVGFGVGLFVALLYLRPRQRDLEEQRQLLQDGVERLKGLLAKAGHKHYEGRIVMCGSVGGPERDVHGKPTAAKAIFNVTLKGRLDGFATLRFEDECEARDMLVDSEVGDVWAVNLTLVKKIKVEDKRVTDWRDTDLASAFGSGGSGKGPLG